MENFEKIKKLQQNADQINNLFDKYIPLWKKESRYDKTGYGFNLDSRFSACVPAKLSLDTWSGVYGDSSCSKVVSIDENIFNQHLVKYLNDNKDTILKSIAESILKEANKYIDGAKKELAEKMKAIEEIEVKK